MTTSERLAAVAPLALELRDVGKRYRLYQKPLYRFLDLFGMCPADAAHYSEHAALHDINLSVSRGEKVAIIGRNGAGKSTLLKIITGVVRQSKGEVDVRGQVSNLLQIGSGFHPDFTGRQNVYATLAHQGITGAAASRIFEEVVDFAEIGEYIDQPMKTYSTGMCSRLMFSSSVIMKPEILIVDEILGVGDAYFSHKSFGRMRELCTRDGTTLLLVTHDIYGARNLCERFVWLDRGEVKFDGDGKSAIALYESSVKEQEEQWLRHRNVAKLAPSAEQRVIHVLLRSQTGFALSTELALASIEIGLHDGSVSRLPVGDGAPAWSLVPEGNLGPRQIVDGQVCRVLRTTGSIYHKAEWVVTLPAEARVKSVRLRYRYEGRESVDVRVFGSDRKLMVSGELGSMKGWQETTFDGNAAGARELEVRNQTDFGSGLVRITSVQFLDRDERDVTEVRHGEPFTVRIGVRLAPELIDRHATFVLAFARHESPYSAYIYEPRIALPQADVCTIDVALSIVELGSGPWYVSVGIGEPNLFDRDVVNYFTIDAAWYHMLAARLELRVASATKVDTYGCFFIHPANVTVAAAVRATAGVMTHDRH